MHIAAPVPGMPPGRRIRRGHHRQPAAVRRHHCLQFAAKVAAQRGVDLLYLPVRDKSCRAAQQTGDLVRGGGGAHCPAVAVEN